MKLNTIQREGQWSNIADNLNENFSKVDNAVEALNQATIKNIGYFATVDALREAYPIASAGAKAYVGSDYPYAIYLRDATTSAWVDSGETGGEESVNLGDYYKKDEVDAIVAEEKKNINGNYFTVKGKYLTTAGVIKNASNSSAITDYIDITGVEQIEVRGRSGALVALVAFYDADKTFISSIYGAEYAGIIVTITKDTIPANAKYIVATGEDDGNDILIAQTLCSLNNAISSLADARDVLTLDLNDAFVKQGYYVHPDNGRVVSTTNTSVVTDYIDITGVEQIEVRGRSGALVALVAFYDADKTFISSIYGAEYAGIIVTITKDTIPANAKYIVATGKDDGNDILKLVVSLAELFKRLQNENNTSMPLSNISAVLTMGASLMYNGNGWIERGCDIVGATSYNKAVSGEMPSHFANLLYREEYCTEEEFDGADVLVLQFSNAGNVFISENIMSIEDYEEQLDLSLTNPFTELSHAACIDYILKKWQKKCYDQKDNPNSKWYGTPFGKPNNLMFVTHWHDARVSYNDSVRELAHKWGGAICEFDKKIGFSKEQPLYDGSQISVKYAVDTETIGSTVYGWHPLRGAEGQYIQRKMANIFANAIMDYFSFR